MSQAFRISKEFRFHYGRRLDTRASAKDHDKGVHKAPINPLFSTLGEKLMETPGLPMD